MKQGRNTCWSRLLAIGVAVGLGWSMTGGGEAYAAAEQTSRDVYKALQSGQAVVSENVYAYVPDKPTVYLTFDDGPSANTGPILDLLREEGITATFFMLGKSVQKDPDMARRVVEEGHVLGNHSYDHVYSTLYSDYGAFWKQVQNTEHLLQDAVGQGTRLVRAPGGTVTNFDPFYFYLLDQAGYVVMDWNVDSTDSSGKNVPVKDIVRNGTKLPYGYDGSRPLVVLMHDGAGHEGTVKALPEIIRFYKENGYAFAGLDPDVEPVQFPLRASRWNRSMSFDSFLAWSEAAREQAAQWPPRPQAGGQEEQENGQAQEEEAYVRIHCHHGPPNWSMQMQDMIRYYVAKHPVSRTEQGDNRLRD